ncbi:MAG: pitrilysin family protein [Acidobacteriota bacterium]|nr:pitrilysin family protein [Acidobacteriota bacterium]
MTKKSMRAMLALFALLAVGVGSSLLAGQTMDKMKGQIQEKTLKNGMKFIVMEQHEAPVASFHIYADVGSAQEVEGITGISHILEHMAFKGTTTLGTKDYAAEAKVLEELDQVYEKLSREEEQIKPNADRVKELKAKFEELQKKAKEYVVNNEYFDMVMQQGDAGVNAYTSSDATQYINSLPANKLEFWMAITSDRFLNPVFREFYKERDVIMEERRLGLETQPMGKLIEDSLAVAFKAHPYHHEVIGHMSDLQRIRHQDVKDYFTKYYSPSNLTAAVVGDVDPQEVFRLAELYFGRIPSGPRPEPLRTREPEQWGERRATVTAQSQPVLVVGYHRPSVRHADNGALDALANIIGQGRSSRIWESLVKKEKAAAQVGCFNGFPGDKYPNLILFFSMPSKDKTAAQSLELIDKEIERIKKEPVSPQELAKYKQMTKKGLIGQMKSNARMAANLTYYDVVQGDWRLLFDELANIDKITAADVQRVANTYLVTTNRTVGEIVPEKK